MSKIEWTGITWNPTTGCNKVSRGCKFCYAEVMHKRLKGMGQAKYQQNFSDGVVTHVDDLRIDFGKKPKMIFVNSMSDLFHKDVPFDFIDNVFAVMDTWPQHTFQILTKRADRMAEYFAENRSWRVGQLKYAYDSNDYDLSAWPLKNVWIGVSVENQEHADERIPYLLQCQAAIRFLSCEPLVGDIDLSKWFGLYQFEENGTYHLKVGSRWKDSPDWVIVGGESGSKKGVTGLHVAWVRSLRDQCKIAGVPFFFKQWGEWGFADPKMDGVRGRYGLISMDGKFIKTNHYPRQMMSFGSVVMERKGKNKTGNLLDGVQHLEIPTL